MSRFGLCGPSYASQSLNADAQATVNWYPEIEESGAGNSPIMLYPTPGLMEFATLVQPSISITKTHSGDFTQGTTGTFTITVTNDGNIDTTSLVTVTEITPAGFTFVSMTGTGWTVVGNVATRSDPLAPAASYPPLTVTVSVSSGAGSPLVNQATVDMGSLHHSVSDSVTVIAGGPFAPLPFGGYIYDLNGSSTGLNSITLVTHASADINPGDAIFITIVQNILQPGSSLSNFTSITDTLGSTWMTLAASGGFSGGANVKRGYVFWGLAGAFVAAGGTFNVTFHLDGPEQNLDFAAVFLGVHGVSTLAISLTAIQSSANPTLTLATASPSLVLSFIVNGAGSMTVAVPFFTQIGFNAEWVAGRFSGSWVSAPGSYAPAWTNAGGVQDTYIVMASFT